jgi:hypothetical protein
MRTYVVKAGDSPASIAAQDDMAGCPKCSIELPRVNQGKPTIVRKNGFVTFRALVVGETLNLPDEWFHPAREDLPAAYYKILPHADGVTPGSLGDALGDYPALDAAVTAVAQLAALDDAAFARSVGDACTQIDAAAQEAYGATRSADAAAKAKTVKDATQWAWQRNRDLAAAVTVNDRATITRARLDIQNALATALGNARLAIVASEAATSSVSPELRAAATAAVAALSADPNYCTSVTHPGTPVNAAVHRFKLAWNASQTPKVPVGTGTYEVATTVALAQVNGSAPSACGANQRPVPAPKPPPPLPVGKQEDLTPPRARSGWSLGSILVGIAAAGAALGGVAYLVTKPNARAHTRREEPAT